MRAAAEILEGRQEVLRSSRALLGEDAAGQYEATTDAVTSARLLGDWATDPDMLRSPEVVIPHLAVEGRVSILSGREKIGKSTLVASAIALASNGKDVFGVRVPDPVRTLWYTNDEPVADTVRRFTQFGAAPDGIIINPEPRTFNELRAALECDLRAFENVGDVVVDTLSRVFAASGVDPNSSREVEPAIAELVDLLHRSNVSGILIYHTGKGGREYRGSTAIGATVDEVLTLRRRLQSEDDDFEDESSDDGRRLLVQDGRNLRGRLQLDFRDGVYRIHEELQEPRERILDALRDNGTVVGRAELTKLAKLRKESGLRVIREMIGSGAIIEHGKHLSAGSPRFPMNGTESEPLAEPLIRKGSGDGEAAIGEQGTAAYQSRVIEREGQDIRQILRPTQHGDKWFDTERGPI